MNSQYDEIYDGLKTIANSITANAIPARDESGGVVGSLTEAVMGVTSGLFAIAHAIESHSSSVDGVVSELQNIVQALMISQNQ